MRGFKIAAISLITMITTITFATGEKQPTLPSKSSNAEIQKTSADPIKAPAEFQKVVEEYKSYVAKIPAEVHEEIITYRKEIAKINKEKRLLYKQLSQEAQNYLKTEEDYKKRLPLNRKSLINVETIGKKNDKK